MAFENRWQYDVFLNFRGEDTRSTFVSHLYAALHEKVNTFIDAEDLRRGNDLSQLLSAIQGSRISIVIISPNYASSTWCLRELVQILRCMHSKHQMVVPIFYQVDPSDVRSLKGSFAQAFARHEQHTNHIEEVRGWKGALKEATNLVGWDSRNYEGGDAKLINDIVGDILEKLLDMKSVIWKCIKLIPQILFGLAFVSILSFIIRQAIKLNTGPHPESWCEVTIGGHVYKDKLKSQLCRRFGGHSP